MSGSEEEEPVEVGEDDVSFFQEHGRFAGFLEGVAFEQPKGRKARAAEARKATKRGREAADGGGGGDSEDSDDGGEEGGGVALEEAYERRRARREAAAAVVAAGSDAAPVRARGLPVKLADGRVQIREVDGDAAERKALTVPQHRAALQAAAKVTSSAKAAEPEDDEGEDDAEDGGADGGAGEGSDEDEEKEEEAGEEAEPKPMSIFDKLTPSQIRARQARRKIEMAQLADEIMESPEKSLHAAGKGPRSASNKMLALHEMCKDEDVVVAKLAMLSELAVLRDILPGYRIRLPTAKERTVKVSKDVRKLRNFERNQLLAYQRYLKHLETAAMGAASSDEAGLEGDRADRRRHSLAVAAVKCMGELLKTYHSFNFRSNLIQALLTKMNHKCDTISRVSCQAISQLFKSDPDGSASLDAVKAMSKVCKTKLSSIRPGAMDTLYSLPLVAGLRDRKPFKKRGKRRRMDEVDEEVEAGLKEADADVSADRKRNQIAIVRELMLVYFRVLRGVGKAVRVLLPPVLRGLSKFAHLIDLAVVVDLLELLKDLLDEATLPTEALFSTVLAAMRVLSGPGKTLSGDESYFSSHLYGLLHRLMFPDGEACIDLALDCLDAILVRRREYRTENVAAFIKRLTLAAPLLPPHKALAVLSFARELFQRYPGTKRLLDAPEDRVSAGTYKATELDLSQCNAMSAPMWEVVGLQSHFHPMVAKFARDLVALKPLAPDESCRRVLVDYDASEGGFNPEIQAPQRANGKAGRSYYVRTPKEAAEFVVQAEAESSKQVQAPPATEGGTFGTYFDETEEWIQRKELHAIKFQLQLHKQWTRAQKQKEHKHRK